MATEHERVSSEEDEDEESGMRAPQPAGTRPRFPARTGMGKEGTTRQVISQKMAVRSKPMAAAP
jgi:hypothetical protein